MMRFSANLILIFLGLICVAGCGSRQQTAWNPFAPYGSPRVPPPSTGSIKPGDNYYPGSAPMPAVSSNTEAEPGFGARDIDPTGVELASFEEEVEDNVATSRLRIQAPSQTAAGSVRLNGMPVNDATQNDEPARFVPPADAVDINALPPTPIVASSENQVPTVRPTRMSSTSNRTTAAGSSSGWRKRR